MKKRKLNISSNWEKGLTLSGTQLHKVKGGGGPTCDLTVMPTCDDGVDGISRGTKPAKSFCKNCKPDTQNE